MYSVDYISTMVSSNEAIYIDTASLMDENLEPFIYNAESVLQSQNRKIIVPRAVCLELTRHLGSRNPEKKERAVRALTLLGDHSDIFEIRNQDIREEEALKAFADSELLAELTLNRAACGQLLITNDRHLSEDAYKLNDQASCRGHKVMVCFINRLGELRKCECAKEALFAARTEEAPVADATPSASESSIITKEHLANQPYPKFNLSHVLTPIGTFAAGFLTCKYGKPALKYITSLF